MKKVLTLIAVLSMLSASTVLGQPPCEGDLNCDGQVTGADTVMYKADYNRTPYLNEPCPEHNPRCGTSDPGCSMCNHSDQCLGCQGDCCCYVYGGPRMITVCMDRTYCSLLYLGICQD